MDTRSQNNPPEEIVESIEREKDLSRGFEDPDMDFLFADDLEKSIA